MLQFICSAAYKSIDTIQAYQPGKAKPAGMPEMIKLASNENPLGPSPLALEAITKALAGLADYPESDDRILKESIASQHGVSAEQVTLGNGSNEVMDLIIRAHLPAGDELVFSEYAFSAYPILTLAVGGIPVSVPARDYGHDLEAMQAAITDKTRIVALVNPNNPTGTCFSQSELHNFLAKVPEHCLVILDEAYAEYHASEADYPNSSALLADYPNLVVLRTFSKAYGLAGLRLGYAIAHPEMSLRLNRIRHPFNVNQLAVVAGQAALADKAHLEKTLQANALGLARWKDFAQQKGIGVIGAAGNFITLEVGNGVECFDTLYAKGIIVRPLVPYQMASAVRITIGTAKQNEKAISALTNYLETKKV